MDTPTKIKCPGLLAIHPIWMSLIIITGFYSLGTTILYPLSFYTAKNFTWQDYDMATDDIAGYLAYLGSLPFLIIFLVTYLVKNWTLFSLGFPRIKSVAVAIVFSSVVMAAPWILMGVFFDRFRFRLPGDGNWPSISVFTALACVHGLFVVLFTKDVSFGSDETDAEQGDSAGTPLRDAPDF